VTSETSLTLLPALKSAPLFAGLTPWRGRGRRFAFPCRRTRESWSERWRSPFDRLGSLAASLRSEGAVVQAGGGADRWDLEVRAGSLGAARLLVAVEEHGRGRQLLRLRIWPRWSRSGLVITAFFALFSALAAAKGLTGTTAVLAGFAATTLFLVVRGCSAAVALCLEVLATEAEPVSEAPDTATTERSDVLEPVIPAEVVTVQGVPE